MALKWVESREEMNPQYKRMVRQLLESQAYRELMAANVFGHALKFVPELKYKQLIAEHITEELEHYGEVCKLYDQLDLGDLNARMMERIERSPSFVPYPKSWFELAMVQFLYDRAGRFHLSEFRNCSDRPYARIVGKILEEEEGHEGFGEKVLKDLCQHPEYRRRAQRLFNRWLPVALLSFGRPGTPGNRYCIKVGLKTRDSGEVMRDFINDIKPTMVECGLKFPPREKMGVKLPEELDLGLP